HFVRLEDIDPVYFEKAYYVAPGRGAEKSYGLLLRTLKETGRVGIGRFVLRTKPHLVALRPMEDALALETLYFGDEVRDAGPLVGDVTRADVTDREVDVSKLLVEALAMEWDPSVFADEYREELLRMIAERTPEHVEEPADGPPPDARVGELLEALKRSVEEAKSRRKPKGGRRAG
ncbi:MAG: Ku protein, partial [Actinomycetota bacterium]